MTRPRSPPHPASDYRQRHPIAIKEGDAHGRAVHRQRARRPHAARSAPTCSPSRRPGGARRPAGSSSTCRRARANARAAADALREVRAILCAAGVPPHGDRRASLSTRPIRRKLRDRPAQLSEHGRRGRAVRAVAAGSRPDLRTASTTRIGRTGTSAARRSAISPPWSTTGRSGAAARRGAALYRPPHHRARQVPPGEGTATHYPDADKGKISDVGQ